MNPYQAFWLQLVPYQNHPFFPSKDSKHPKLWNMSSLKQNQKKNKIENCNKKLAFFLRDKILLKTNTSP
jgi:hypothetical protein